jgi:hypothetical protein
MNLKKPTIFPEAALVVVISGFWVFHVKHHPGSIQWTDYRGHPRESPNTDSAVAPWECFT